MVSVVVIGHQDIEAVINQIEMMKQQSQPPVQIIASVCCMDTREIDADIIVSDRHQDDTGQRLCDYGIRLAIADYVLLASCDDKYNRKFIETLSNERADIIHCDFHSHLLGRIVASAPVTGEITRGSFIVKTTLAQKVGYNHRTYDGDGKFIEDLKEAGATDKRVEEVLYEHL